MRRTILTAACRTGVTSFVVLLLALGWSATAVAQGNQFGAPSIQRPTTSPYLNLYRGTNRALDLGLNYQRRVRPEQDLRRYSAGLNNNIGALQNDFDRVIGPDGSVRVPGTGHQTSFQNTGGYFSGGGRAPSYSGTARSGTGRSGGRVGQPNFRGR